MCAWPSSLRLGTEARATICSRGYLYTDAWAGLVMQLVACCKIAMPLLLPANLLPRSDWAQCFVLELVSSYQPAGEQERFDILEVGARPGCSRSWCRAGRC